MFRTSSRGFTLIELLVVIAIIGILSSVVLASLNDARQKSRDAKRIADIKQMQLALELYFDSNGRYPTSTGSLVPDFMPALPDDPIEAQEYVYAYFTNGTEYHLGATLEQDSHSALDSDADFNSDGASGWTGGFNGEGSVYDVRP